MDNFYLIIIASFVLSFIFALGGVGAAVALVPFLNWAEVPFNLAKAVGLFTNTISLSGASYYNIKNKKIDFKLAVPLIIASGIFAPLGAWSSNYISKEISIYIFILFLILSGSMMIFFKGARLENNYRENVPLFITTIIGAIAGLISGLLGVGGGSFISPLLIIIGFSPKKVAAITAFVVPFSSFLAFLTYVSMTEIQWDILLFAASAAYLGGYLGTRIMHNKMKTKFIKKFLGIILFLIAIKLIIRVT